MRMPTSQLPCKALCVGTTVCIRQVLRSWKIFQLAAPECDVLTLMLRAGPVTFELLPPLCSRRSRAVAAGDAKPGSTCSCRPATCTASVCDVVPECDLHPKTLSDNFPQSAWQNPTTGSNPPKQGVWDTRQTEEHRRAASLRPCKCRQEGRQGSRVALRQLRHSVWRQRHIHTQPVGVLHILKADAQPAGWVVHVSSPVHDVCAACAAAHSASRLRTPRTQRGQRPSGRLLLHAAKGKRWHQAHSPSRLASKRGIAACKC